MSDSAASVSGAHAQRASHGRLTSIATSLGIDSWPHGDAALEEALRVLGEQERTKQEYYRLESRQRILDILNVAVHLGIPGPAVPLLFTGNEDLAAANSSRLASASQANTAVATAHAALQAAALSPSSGSGSGGDGGATAISSHGPFRFSQPGVPTYHLQPPFQPHMQPSSPSAVQHPAKSQQGPVTPSRTGSTDRSGLPSASRSNGRGGSPVQQQLQPAFAQGQPNSNSRFDVLSFDRPQDTPDRNRLGHRATASAVPAYTSDTPRAVPLAPGTSSHASPVQMTPVPAPMSSAPFYPPHLTAPPQMSSASPNMAPQLSQFQASAPYSINASSPGQHMGSQQQVPALSVTPSRLPPNARNRSHGASASTSDLQIHQWKPKQLNRDNRWKVMSSPYGPQGKDRTGEQPGPPPPKMAAQQGSDSATPDIARAPAHQSPPPRPPSATSSTSVVASQNTRRRSAGHTRSRSSVSALPQHPPVHSYSSSVSRHDEGVAVLASLASEQNKIGYENVKSEMSDSSPRVATESTKHQRLPSLLSYLESQAKSLPSPAQRAPPGGAGEDSPPHAEQAPEVPSSGQPGGQKM